MFTLAPIEPKYFQALRFLNLLALSIIIALRVTTEANHDSA